MPKKKQINGFVVYMQELMEEMRHRQGYHFPNGIPDVVPIARPKWLALSEAEKEVFNRKAKEQKRIATDSGDANKHRRDNQGNVIADRANVKGDRARRRLKEREQACSRWPVDHDITQERFYLVGCEYLCQVEEEAYLPVEIGLVEWSMETGISNTFHRFINPGPIPLGYRFSCQSHSDDTHQVPIENFEKATSDYRGVFQSICEFMHARGHRQTDFPPLYCLGVEEEWDCVRSCLDWLHYAAGVSGDQPLGKLYALDDMVEDLYSHSGKAVSNSHVINMLTTSAFDYEPNTRCAYHEEKETKHCALGTCKRYAFAMSDALSNVFEFELTGNHLPTQNDYQPRFTVISPSSITVEPRPRLPDAQRGGARRGGRPREEDSRFGGRDVRLKQQQQSEDNSDEDEKQSMYSNYPPATGVTQNGGYGGHSAAWGRPAQSDAPEEKDWPSLGGGGPPVSEPRYAGTRNAPPAKTVPLPVTWSASGSAAGSPPRSEASSYCPGVGRGRGTAAPREPPTQVRGTTGPRETPGRGRGTTGPHETSTQGRGTTGPRETHTQQHIYIPGPATSGRTLSQAVSEKQASEVLSRRSPMGSPSGGAPEVRPAHQPSQASVPMAALSLQGLGNPRPRLPGVGRGRGASAPRKAAQWEGGPTPRPRQPAPNHAPKQSPVRPADSQSTAPPQDTYSPARPQNNQSPARPQSTQSQNGLTYQPAAFPTQQPAAETFPLSDSSNMGGDGDNVPTMAQLPPGFGLCLQGYGRGQPLPQATGLVGIGRGGGLPSAPRLPPGLVRDDISTYSDN